MQPTSTSATSRLSANTSSRAGDMNHTSNEAVRKSINKPRFATDIVSPSNPYQEIFTFLFWIGVCTLTVVLWTAYPAYLPVLHCVLAPILFVIRYFQYKVVKWQFLFLDVCYSFNLLFLIFLLLKPQSAELFQVVCILFTGPVISGVIPFRNSLVFHNMDKMISVFLHVSATLVLYKIRWYAPDTSLIWNAWIGKTIQPQNLNTSSFWLMAVPTICLYMHTILYHLIVNIIIKPDETYATSYRLISVMKGSFTYRMMHRFGPRYAEALYHGIYASLSTAFVVIAQIAYHYQAAHLALLTSFLLIVVWNGGSYYIHIFSRYKTLKARQENNGENQT